MPRSSRVTVVVGLMIGLLGVAPASAQSGKYQFMKATENRVWRLDTESGEIAVCTLRGENLVCTASSDAAMAPKKSYAEMQAERAEDAERAAARRQQRQETEMKIIDRVLAFFRDLIALAKDQDGAN